MEKKKNYRFLFIFITLMSLCAFLYLNSVELNTSEIAKVEQKCMQEEEQFLPEVKAVKKAFGLAKKFFPAI